MDRVKLCCEFLAPLFVLVIFSITDSYSWTLVTILIIHLILFLPQFLLLVQVLKRRPQLNLLGKKTSMQCVIINPLTVVWNGISLLRQQAYSLLLMSNAFSTMVIIRPFNVVFIVYLKWLGLDLWAIAVFVVAGSLMGSSVFGSWIYVSFLEKCGLFSTARIYLLLHTLTLLIACILSSLQSTVGIIFFLCSIAASSAGYYGFSVCKLQFLERMISSSYAPLKSSVTLSSEEVPLSQHLKLRETIYKLDNAFAALSELILYTLAVLINVPTAFVILIWISFSCALFGMILFGIWSLIKTNRNSIMLP